MSKIDHYRPSNGTEGMWFEGKFCDKCAKDDVDKGIDCMIRLDMFFDNQRDEWCYIDKEAVCTAFTSEVEADQEKMKKEESELIKSGQTHF